MCSSDSSTKRRCSFDSQNNDGKNAEGRRGEEKNAGSRGKSPNGARLYDPNGFRRRATALCVRIENGELQILLVTSGSKRYWILPGGGVEAHETIEEAVKRELWEEAGVEGTIISLIDEPWMDEERLHHTRVFIISPTRILDEWEDSKNGRERRWMDIDGACQHIKPHQNVIIEKNIDTIRKLLRPSVDVKAQQEFQS